MTERFDVFLSYSRNDQAAANRLFTQLGQLPLKVFQDHETIHAGDEWLLKLQDAVDLCGAFVLLVGQDGVSRWIGAETQVALSRYFGPHDEADRLPIFPILLGDTAPEGLPAFLRLFQARSWDGTGPLSEDLVQQIRERVLTVNEDARFEGCPFVGLQAYTREQAQLFFGRQKETLDALSVFDTRKMAPKVRWLEINGGSGSGKSSLMNAGILPLVDQGWLWPRTRIEEWRRIGPIVPGERPLDSLIEALAQAFGTQMADVRPYLETDQERALSDWLRSQPTSKPTGYLLALDQFEELFTLADRAERQRLDRQLAAALAEPKCPFFLISTVRLDFLDRFDLLPRLAEARNRMGRQWTLPMMSAQSLREVIDGPARLADLDASEVRDAIVDQAEGEAGALPLVQGALTWLWKKRDGRRLSGQRFYGAGGIAGILSTNADNLMDDLPAEVRENALRLLLRLVRVDPEGNRHSRLRLSLEEAIAAAGGGAKGEALVDNLSGRPSGDMPDPLRLIVVNQDTGAGAGSDRKASVSLIHEALIQTRGVDEIGNPKPLWPRLWARIEADRSRAVMENVVRMRALEIEDAAKAWQAAGRQELPGWDEARIQRILRDVAQAGVPVGRLFRSDLARAFFGPADWQNDRIAHLLAALEDDAVETGSGRYGPKWTLPLSHRARADLGDRLDILGDRRKGVGVVNALPDIDWVPIDVPEVGFVVRIEDNKQIWTSLVRPFHMARYPVTVTQFRAFVEACYRERDGQWAVKVPFDPARLAGPPRFTATHENQPADSVSWYLATAFCCWLEGKVGKAVRLPNEFEWQLAATGGVPKKSYPWNAEAEPERNWAPSAEPWRANTSESELRRSTAVGMYPLGAAANNVQDLSGTILEWCANRSDDPCSADLSTEEARGLRGGSWSDDLGSAQCAGRDRLNPNNRLNNIGFRVVCSSPIKTSDP